MSPRVLTGCLATLLLAVVIAVVAVRAIQSQNPDEPDSSSFTPKTNAASYLVREGDSLSVIAERTGVPVEELERLNPRVDPLSLVPGRRIKLRPTPPSRRAIARRRGPRRSTYVVKQGDTLSSIAVENDTQLGRLLELNRKLKRPDRLVPGQRIRLRRAVPSRRRPGVLR